MPEQAHAFYPDFRPRPPTEFETHVTALYSDPVRGLVSAARLLPTVRETFPDASLQDVEYALASSRGYQKTRAVKRPRARAHYDIANPGMHMCADLAIVPQYADNNDGVNVWLCAVDIHTRYGFVVPLRNKTATAVLDALKSIMAEWTSLFFTYPMVLETDSGTEFFNATLTRYLAQHAITHKPVLNEIGSPHAEIFVRSIKRRVQQYLATRSDAEYTKQTRYIDALPDIVEGYNNTIHSTTKLSPADAVKPENYGKTRQLGDDIPSRTASDALKDAKFRPGDLVRIAKYKQTFKKEYLTENFSDEVFRIRGKSFVRGAVQYKLEDILGEDIEGSFYDSELVLQHPSVWDEPLIISFIHEAKVIDGVDMRRVSFLGWDDKKFERWIPADSDTPVLEVAIKPKRGRARK